MTTRTMSAETAPAAVSPDGASRATAWDNMRGDASNGESLPPSIPPADGHMASPVDIVGRGSAQSASSPETASAEPLPPSIPPKSWGVEGQGQNTDEHVDEKDTYGFIEIPRTGRRFPYKINSPDSTIDTRYTRFAQNAGEQTSADASADESISYEDRGRQIIAGATERARAGSKELSGRAGAGIKRIAGKLVRLARSGVKTVGETAGKGASVAVGFAAIEGPKAAKATAEKASEAREKSAQKIHELAESARKRRKLRKNNREAAKAWREREYKDRQRARKRILGKIARRNKEIKDGSESRSTDIETDKADISDKKGELKRREVAAKAAKSEARKAERCLKRLETKKKKAQDKYDRAKEASDNNPDNIRAQAALKRAEGNLEAAKLLYDAGLNYKTELDSKREDRFSEVDRSRQGLRELRDRVADAKRDNNDGRVERLENAASSAFTRVAEFVDGSTAAHDLLRRAGRAIRRKFQGGNRQEAKTA